MTYACLTWESLEYPLKLFHNTFLVCYETNVSILHMTFGSKYGAILDFHFDLGRISRSFLTCEVILLQVAMAHDGLGKSKGAGKSSTTLPLLRNLSKASPPLLRRQKAIK